MFEDKQHILDDYLNISESRQQQLLKDILVIANQDKEKFADYVHHLDFGLDSPKSIFYEAIWKSPIGWESFLLAEIKHLIQSAERNEEGAIHELTSLFYLAQNEGLDKNFYDEAVEFFIAKLDSKSASVRKACMEGIFEMMDVAEYEISSDQKNKLQSLLYDEDFEVRLNAYSNLDDFDLVPNNFKFSFKDKLRIKVTGQSYLIE